ncbi:MAG: putative pre6S rRNA nuclease [Frankiaceae bacterium]|jgi:putative Holliday junction resolvase|nr:putative pre6S rRNA nuclease [Frankiaceae bacterium]
MTTGVRLGIDVGSVRVGVAASDPSGLLASPVMTLRRDLAAMADLASIAGLVTELAVVEVIVGLPRSLSGKEGPAAAAARDYARQVADRVAPVAVRLVDERLSTVSASRALGESGVRGRERRAVIDQQAAVTFLQAALDAARGGVILGEAVEATP